MVSHGTMFSVTIPLGRSHLPADRIGDFQVSALTAVGAEAYIGEMFDGCLKAAAMSLRSSRLSSEFRRRRGPLGPQASRESWSQMITQTCANTSDGCSLTSTW